MSPRRMILIAVALFALGFTFFLVRGWLDAQRQAALDAQRQQPAVQQPSTMVLVAKGDLVAGQFVRPENLRWQPWPNDGISPNYVVQGQRALEDFVGAVVRSAVSDGEPITDTRLVRPGDRGFLAAVLTPGNRAVTVNLTPSSGVAGFIFPGDHVDLIATLTIQPKPAPQGSNTGNPQPFHASETVLRDLRVLAIDQRADDQNKEIVVAKTATLEVTPKQAEIIAVVGEIGKLSLALRSIARDEAEAALEASRRGPTYTLDSEATRLVGSSGDIAVVRGSVKPAQRSSFFGF